MECGSLIAHGMVSRRSNLRDPDSLTHKPPLTPLERGKSVPNFDAGWGFRVRL
jgi:hypothetical protein